MTDAEKKILNYFCLLKKHLKVGSSYLFIGDNFSLVKDVVKLVSCSENDSFCNLCWDCRRIEAGNHPDLFILEPEALTIGIESIREGQRFLRLKSFGRGLKVLLVKQGETLSLEAQAAFLKTLEEPPKSSFIVISASKLESLGATIISRCRKIFLPPQEEKFDSFQFYQVSHFLRGGEVSIKSRQELNSFFLNFITLFRDHLVYKTTSQDRRLLKKGKLEVNLNRYGIEETETILENALRIHRAHKNININLALNLIRMELK